MILFIFFIYLFTFYYYNFFCVLELFHWNVFNFEWRKKIQFRVSGHRGRFGNNNYKSMRQSICIYCLQILILVRTNNKRKLTISEGGQWTRMIFKKKNVRHLLRNQEYIYFLQLIRGTNKFHSYIFENKRNRLTNLLWPIVPRLKFVCTEGLAWKNPTFAEFWITSTCMYIWAHGYMYCWNDGGAKLFPLIKHLDTETF
jgi:hypothetical protein